jgi:hypothetical protein
MIEEVVEELIQECVEFGYTLDEASVAVENAAILYLNEAKVTYGSDTESPEQRRERAKAKVGEKKAAARKAAVKTAVGRAKAKAVGAAAGASIAASVAKDAARRAGRTAVHKVKYGAEKKKEQIKSGVKSLIGRGLRKAAGAVGKVAQKAAGAASRLGEEVINEASYSAKAARAGKDIGKPGKQFAKIAKSAAERYGSKERGEKVAGAVLAKLRKEEVDVFDLVLEYLLKTGHAETISEAKYIMSQMDQKTIEEIVEGVMPEPIDPTAHKEAQRLARQQGKVRALEAGATTPGEQKAAQSKLRGPQLPGV